MTEPYSILRIGEIQPISVAGLRWKPIRRTLGIDAFGINAYTAAAAGEHVVEEHSEETLGHQEAYVVIAGHATFTLDGTELDAPNGTVVFIPDPTVRRHAVAVEAGTTVLAIGGLPGTFTPSSWEWYFGAEQFRESGDHAAALELLADAQARFPADASVLYSQACWQSLAGDPDAAIASLQAALDLEPRVAEWSNGDADLDPIRGLPGSPV